jgi:hypothetical protein
MQYNNMYCMDEQYQEPQIRDQGTTTGDDTYSRGDRQWIGGKQDGCGMIGMGEDERDRKNGKKKGMYIQRRRMQTRRGAQA